jgi:hypothetical protein
MIPMLPIIAGSPRVKRLGSEIEAISAIFLFLVIGTQKTKMAVK